MNIQGIALAAIFAVGATGAATPVWAQTMEDEISAIQAATAKYSDVAQALADGYVRDPSNSCVTAAEAGLPPEMGAMGIHYLNMAALGLAPPGGGRVDGNGLNTDFSAPSVLIYEPQEDGSLMLVGVENLIFAAAWQEAGNSMPPMFAGAPWLAMADDATTPPDEGHGFEAHYETHVWSARANPAGPTVSFNPAVSCKYFTG